MKKVNKLFDCVGGCGTDRPRKPYLYLNLVTGDIGVTHCCKSCVISPDLKYDGNPVIIFGSRAKDVEKINALCLLFGSPKMF